MCYKRDMFIYLFFYYSRVYELILIAIGDNFKCCLSTDVFPVGFLYWQVTSVLTRGMTFLKLALHLGSSNPTLT